jgi:hypothetical protein
MSIIRQVMSEVGEGGTVSRALTPTANADLLAEFSQRFVTRDRKIKVQKHSLHRVLNDLDTDCAIQLEEARVG